MTYRTVTLDELLELLPKPKDGKAWQERIQDLTRPMTGEDERHPEPEVLP